ncbi:MAG: ATP-dependent helicase [Lachnospiraceae bacterium]
MIDIDKAQLNHDPAQARAVAHQAGPMLVLAGPGSGKTTVITKRIQKLLHEDQVNPIHILVVTFSKAAAVSMKQRFLSAEKSRSTRVTFGTFHGVFYGILKSAYKLTAANILKDEQKHHFLKELVYTYAPDLKEEGELVVDLAQEISFVKGNQLSLEDYHSTSCPQEAFHSIFQGYQLRCRQEKLLDFDDMLQQCLTLLQSRADILKAWQDTFQYIMVDEFQDCNSIQYEVIRLLAAPQDNLFVVGDDDQSIYCFRGARPGIMLGFTKDYPQAASVLLDMNYRSTQSIVASASLLIQENQHRFAKKLTAYTSDGPVVEILSFADGHRQREYLMQDIKRYRENGGVLRECTVLLRTNLEAMLLADTFIEHGIEFALKEQLPSVFSHWIAKDIMAYLSMAQGEIQRADFLRVMNRPNRYIARNVVRTPKILLEELFEAYHDKEWMCERIDQLEDDLARLAQMSPYAAINYIRRAIGYDAFLHEYARYRRILAEELLNLADQILESAKECRTLADWKQKITLHSRKLKEQCDRQQQNPTGVAVSTLHAAKGLEFDRVYILNANEGTIPYRKAVTQEAIEEERRLLYVGITRARKEIKVCFAASNQGKPLERSRFLGEMICKKPSFILQKQVM